MVRRLRPLDEVLARAAGLREPPDVEWPSLIEVGDQEQAEASKMKADALAVAIDKGAIDEDEMRRQLDGDPIFGSLEGEAPGLPEPEMPAMPGANGSGVPAGAGANGNGVGA